MKDKERIEEIIDSQKDPHARASCMILLRLIDDLEKIGGINALAEVARSRDSEFE